MSDKKEYPPPSQPPPNDGENRPLPEGWIKQFDPNSNAWFYVDTKASPHRSIWLHPLDDPQFLEQHPHFQDYDHPPQYEGSPSPPPVPTTSRPSFVTEKEKPPGKRSFLGKLKDKAIGTKEERAAAKEQARRAREEERRQRIEWQRAHAAQYGSPPQFGGYQQQYAGPSQGFGQPAYVQQGQPMYGRPRRGGGMALPLLGGLAGGLLLGDMLGGDGGDFGGGF